MAITALSTYSGVTPNKDTQTPTIFSAACDTSFSWIMTTLFTSINNFISQINTQLIPTSPTTVTSATYAVIDTDDAIIFNATATCTLTLPAAGGYAGRIINVKTIAAYAVNSASSNVKPISTNTAGTVILTNSVGKWASLQSDGTNWITMMNN